MTGADKVDLRTTYLGLELSSPIVASASPLTGAVEGSKALADAGVGAVVLPSLFEEEIVAEEVGLSAALEAGSGHFAEALDYFPAVTEFKSAVDRYLELLEHTKKAVDVPVIASLNASSTGGWVRYAHLLADAGADALELNVYRVADRPSPERGASRGAGPRPRRERVRRRGTASRGEALPLLLGHGALCRQGGQRRSRADWSCSTASTSPTWTSRPWTWCRGWSCRAAGSSACPCAGSPSCDHSWGVTRLSRPARASTRDTTS